MHRNISNADGFRSENFGAHVAHWSQWPFSIMQQECIPVGCVPPAAVAVGAGGYARSPSISPLGVPPLDLGLCLRKQEFALIPVVQVLRQHNTKSKFYETKQKPHKIISDKYLHMVKLAYRYKILQTIIICVK